MTALTSQPDRHGVCLSLAEELLTDIELSRVSIPRVVLKASRLARLMRDEQAQDWLGWEISGYRHDGSDLEHLRLSGRVTDEAEGTAFTASISELCELSDAEEAKLAAFKVSAWSGDMALVASREQRAAVSQSALSMSSVRAVEARVMSRVHGWVTQALQELQFSGMQADLFNTAQAEIDGRLASIAGSSLSKIESIGQRLRSGDAESVSQAMSTCRRLIDSAADALFDSSEQPYRIGDVSLAVRHNNVLNRVQAYVADHVESKGRRDRLRRTLADIYERTSTGTHSEVSGAEARYLFLQTYVVLGEILSLDERSV